MGIGARCKECYCDLEFQTLIPTKFFLNLSKIFHPRQVHWIVESHRIAGKFLKAGHSMWHILKSMEYRINICQNIPLALTVLAHLLNPFAPHNLISKPLPEVYQGRLLFRLPLASVATRLIVGSKFKGWLFNYRLWQVRDEHDLLCAQSPKSMLCISRSFTDP